MTKTIRWGGYPRISEDPNDLQSGVTRQREDIIRGVVSRGGDAEDITWYPENDTSAYKKRRVKKTDSLGNEYVGYRVIRPVWHRALHDLRIGKIDALMVWDLDRLARDPRDLEDAIEVVQYYGKHVEGVRPGEINLTSDGGIAMARVIVAMNAKSSADTGRRVKRVHLDNAKNGVPVGGYRPFGWKVDKRTLDPAEKQVVLDVVARLLGGESLRKVVQGLNDQGVLTTAGKPWKPATLRQYLRSPRLIGQRTYKGEVVKDEHGMPVQGQWEPLLSTDDWDRLQILFSKPDNRARVPRRDARHYLLTGTLRCGVCNALMYGNRVGQYHGEERYYYMCNRTNSPKHSLGVSGHGLDRMVAGLVLGRIAEGVDDIPEQEWQGQARLVELETLIADTLDQLGKPGIQAAWVFGQAAKLGKELDAVKAEREEWLVATTGPRTTEVTTPQEWDALDADRRRALVEQYLEALYVKPAAKKQNRFDPERIVPVWRESPRP